MKTDAQIATRIEEIEQRRIKIAALMRPLEKEDGQLQRELGDLQSEQYIRINGITKANTQESNVPGKRFGIITEFGKWLAVNPNHRPWAEWNGRIYRSSDLIKGRMPESPALYESLK